jgi:hypothetical protein
MDLAAALLEVGTGRAEASFTLFAQTLDPQWIAQALQATGTASVRRRKLPAEYVVWLVIGMGLLRDRSIEEVVRHLHLVLPGVEPPAQAPVTGSAIVQARDRLGDQPLETLFATTAARWATDSAHEHRWRGLAVYGWMAPPCACRIAPRTTRPSAVPRPGAAAPGIRRCALSP